MSQSSFASGAVAVVGMAGRFPGASDVRLFWRNLCAGRESVVRYSEAELRAAGEDSALLADPEYVPAGAPLDGIDLFDAGFFGFSAREAAILDPQHRQFLEVCWEALEDAGHVPQAFDGAIGVFAGAGMHDYYVHHLAPNRRLMRDVGAFLVRHTGNDKDFLTTRVSYCLDLTGPSIGVQTACSTSLVAIHMAAQSLLNGECDMALAGGVTIVLPDRLGYVHREGEILSPDGHCRPFDRAARGTLFGSGAGVVVLRRAEDAAADSDHIYALIRGSAVNNDGRGKVSYLAPSLDGQARCVAEALAVAGVAGSSIGYVEAHGTGTPVGDPIEIAALTQAFGAVPPSRCAVGSVKSNIGHLDAAAGVASFIKTALAVHHGVVPASLHFAAPNPECHFETSPFFVNGELRPWPAIDGPRRAGVNSLGVGGTNAHVILEECVAPAPASADGAPHLLCLSARSPAALAAAARRLADFLDASPGTAIADVAFTLQHGRRAFPHRRALVCRDVEAARRLLRAHRSGDRPRQAPTTPPPVVFMFPGGGAQYPNMGRELYEREAVFRLHLDEVLQIAEREHAVVLRPWLFPAAEGVERAAARLEGATTSLVSTLAVEWAMARWWQSQGIVPAAVIGHSLGEVVAACVAGVFSVRDAIALIVARGRVLDQLPLGATLAVPLAENELRPLLGPGVSLAAVNGAELCVVSGSVDAVIALEARLSARDVETRRLRLSFAAHSELLDGHLDGFAAEIASLRFARPTIPVMSNASARWATAEEIGQPDYWVRQLRDTVRYADGLTAVLEAMPDCVLLDLGPGTTLASVAALRHDAGRTAVVASMRHPLDSTPDADVLLGAAGALWAAGVPIDWTALRGSRRAGRRMSLPTYPFEHARYWIDPPARSDLPARGVDAASGSAPSDEWLWAPQWRVAETPAPAAGNTAWLVFDSDTSLLDPVLSGLRAGGDHVIRVVAGGGFEVRADGAIMIRAGDRSDYDRLLGELAARDVLPTRVAHLWGLAPYPDCADPLDIAVEESFFGLLSLVQAWDHRHGALPLHIAVVSAGVHPVDGDEAARPERAVSLGVTLVVPREYPSITCANIDWTPGPWRVDDLVAELRAASPAPIVAWRGQRRLLPAYERHRPPAAAGPGLVRRRGVYLITGGFGGLGLALAEHLGRTFAARLVLVGRQVPDRAEWPGLMAGGGPLAERLRRVVALEQQGIEVLPLSADAADIASLSAAVDAAITRFGGIDGIFHVAGVIDDQPIALKTRESAAAVLRPKLYGVRAIDAVAARLRPEFVVLYWSISALVGVPGQVDYAAANAYLNARAGGGAPGSPRTIVVDWVAWRDVGMAADLHRRMLGAAVDHPLLGHRRDAGGGRVVYTATTDPVALWPLDEHRLADGTAVLPGAAYLDMLRAAVAAEAPGRTVTVERLLLLAPLKVAAGATCQVRLELAPQETGRSWRATIASRTDTVGPWTENARAQVQARAVPAPPRLDLEALAAACRVGDLRCGPEWRSRQERHLRLGRRWRSLARVRHGRGQALIELDLPAPFHPDLERFALHPALLDQAIGGALTLLPDDEAGESFYVPMACERLTVWRSCPATLRVHVRRAPADDGTVAFDMTVADEHGEVCAVIERLILGALATSRALALPSGTAAAIEVPAEPVSTLEALLAAGIDSAGALAALDALLAAPGPARVVVSPLPLESLATRLGALHPARRTAPPLAHQRRPGTPAEELLAATWAGALGLDSVGVDDNWFELGGHSLLGLRVLAQVRRAFGVDLPPQFFFEAPTIAAQAAAIAGVASAASKVVDTDRIVPVDREQFRRQRGGGR